MIVSCVSYKGGSGKTTVSQNLAVFLAHQGKEVCIIDADGTEASSTWAGRRGENDEIPHIPVIQITDSEGFIKSVNNLGAKYDYIIIDGPPSLSSVAAKIIFVSDIIVVPVRPGSGSDIWVTDKFLEFYEAVMERDPLGRRIPVHFVLTEFMERYNMHKAYVQVLETYQESGYKTLKTRLASRIAYGEANQAGLGVFEYDNKLAKQEIQELGQEIVTIEKEFIATISK